jgi:maltose alpha-D-glucosyltransferase/alpha-amylase
MACSLVKKDPGKKETIKLWQEIRQMFDREYPEAVLISEWTYAPQALKAGFHCDFMIHCGTPGYTTLFRNEAERDIFNKFIRERFFEPDGNDYRTLNRNSYFDANGKGSAKMFFDIYLDHWKRTKNQGFISIPSGNHDLPRVSDFRSEQELKTVFAFLLTMPGVPFIYYGDEIGMRNLKELPGKEGGYTRTQARTPMQWDNSVNHGFSTAEKENLYLPVDSSSDAPTVESLTRVPHSR